MKHRIHKNNLIVLAPTCTCSCSLFGPYFPVPKPSLHRPPHPFSTCPLPFTTIPPTPPSLLPSPPFLSQLPPSPPLLHNSLPSSSSSLLPTIISDNGTGEERVQHKILLCGEPTQKVSTRLFTDLMLFHSLCPRPPALS